MAGFGRLFSGGFISSFAWAVVVVALGSICLAESRVGLKTSAKQSSLSTCFDKLLPSQSFTSFSQECLSLTDKNNRKLGDVCLSTSNKTLRTTRPLKVTFLGIPGSTISRVYIGLFSDCSVIGKLDANVYPNLPFTKIKTLTTVRNNRDKDYAPRFRWFLKPSVLIAERNCCDVRPLCLRVQADFFRKTTSTVLVRAVPGQKNPELQMNCKNVIRGTNGDDRLDGTEYVDFIYGFGGNDRLRGFGGDDKLVGGSGDDRVFAGDGDDRVFLNDGDDFAIGDPGNDKIFGDAGDDYIAGQEDADRLFGGSGEDVVKGGGGADFIDGGDDDDRLYGEGGQDHVLGRRGHDYIHGGADDDTLEGGDGDDTVLDNAVTAESQAPYATNIISGGNGNDYLKDTSEYDSEIDGGYGDDRIIGGERQFGGPGNDYLRAGGYGGLYQSGGPGDDEIRNTNSNRYQGAFAIVKGDDGDDTIYARSRRPGKKVYGGDGNDEITLEGGYYDRIYGDAGDDTITATDDKVQIIDGGDGNDTINGLQEY